MRDPTGRTTINEPAISANDEAGDKEDPVHRDITYAIDDAMTKEKEECFGLERDCDQQYIEIYEITKNDLWAEALVATEEMVKRSKSPEEAIARLQEMKNGLYIAMQIRIEPSTLEKLVSHPSSHHLLSYKHKVKNNETVLHAAILSGDVSKVEILCNELARPENERIKRDLLNSGANASDSKDTVMLGELPLSIAALKLNRNIVEYILKLGADVGTQNSSGDTVVHSLIKFAANRPEKMVDIRNMMQFIYTYMDKEIYDVETVFTMENYDNLSPLQLAVTESVSDLSILLLSLRKVYRMDMGSDGIYDRKLYDITILDSITNKITNKRNDSRFAPSSNSILELIFANNTEADTGLELVNHEIISYLIRKKWKSYMPLFCMWMIFHISFVILLTAYSVVRIEFYFVKENVTLQSVLAGQNDHDFVIVSYWIILILDICAFIHIIIFLFSRTFTKSKPWKYLAHNIDYFVMYLIFVIGIIVDTIYLIIDTSEYSGEALIFSVLFGWLFSTFFLRAFPKCGYLTALVRRVIIRDILGFVLVFFFLLVAFTTSLHDLLKYKTDENGNKEIVSEYQSFGRTMFLLLHAMFGLSEVNGIFEARTNWLAILLLILFLLITYALLVNALIGIISSTSEEIFQQKHGHMAVDKLSVLLFMEDMFALPFWFKPIGYRIHRKKQGLRFLIEIKSESLTLLDDKQVIAREKKNNLRLRNTICDALSVNNTTIYEYKCVNCKRREMVLKSNKTPTNLKLKQQYILDSNGRVVDNFLER